MKFLNKMKKNQKGFTLVEIIVVLVILAVLAAFTIPTMLGFVNEARGKAYLAEAREVYVAAQATATEHGAKGTEFTNKDLNSTKQAGASANKANVTMHNYIGDDLTTGTKIPDWKVALEMKESKPTGKVTKVEYKKDGYLVTIDNAGSATAEKGGDFTITES